MAGQQYIFGLMATLLATLLCQASHAQFALLACEEVSKFAEKTVCSNPKLAQMDINLVAQLEHAYKVTQVPLTVLELTQKNWIQQRNQCKNTACLESSYQHRLQEVKSLNATDQDFVQYLVRAKNSQPDPQLALLQLQTLDEKRIRVIAQSFWNSKDKQHSKVAVFNGYANQGKKIRVKDLDTQCILKITQHQDQWEVRQASPMCGNKNVRFSGFYQLQKQTKPEK